MNIWVRLVAIGFAAFSTISYVETASAQATRTWVSGVGDDANPCSRTAPCKTWAGAISKTAAGGEINCIDAGAFGTVTITKSITISCDDFEAGILDSGSNGVLVNAGATDVVVLRGLDLDSSPTSAGLNGVRFLAGGALHIEDCVIRDHNSASPNGHGIIFMPSTGTPELHVSNSWITGNGTGTTGAGIQIMPSAAAGAKVVIENTYVVNSVVGIRADATGTTGAIDISVSDSSATGGAFHGFVAIANGSGPVRMMLKDVVSSNNAGDGVRAVGANALVRMGASIITGNANGVVTNGGVVQSYGTNQISGNVNDGVTPTIIGLK